MAHTHILSTSSLQKRPHKELPELAQEKQVTPQTLRFEREDGGRLGGVDGVLIRRVCPRHMAACTKFGPGVLATRHSRQAGRSEKNVAMCGENPNLRLRTPLSMNESEAPPAVDGDSWTRPCRSTTMGMSTTTLPGNCTCGAHRFLHCLDRMPVMHKNGQDNTPVQLEEAQFATRRWTGSEAPPIAPVVAQRRACTECLSFSSLFSNFLNDRFFFYFFHPDRSFFLRVEHTALRAEREANCCWDKIKNALGTETTNGTKKKQHAGQYGKKTFRTN